MVNWPPGPTASDRRELGYSPAVDQSDWNQRYRSTELLWSAGPNQFVVPELSDLPPGRALDLAAGEGRNSIWLASRGWQVTAVDFADVAVQRGRAWAERIGVQVDWLVADLTGYVPATQAYDLVLLAYLQLPWPSMQQVLGRAADAVAPGGTLLLVGHDTRNLAEGYGGPKSTEFLYSPEAVSAGLRGLTIVRAATVPRKVETDQGPRVALDCLVRAVRA